MAAASSTSGGGYDLMEDSSGCAQAFGGRRSRSSLSSLSGEDRATPGWPATRILLRLLRHARDPVPPDVL